MVKILIATDGSECSMHAVEEAARLLPLAAAECHVMAVAAVSASEGLGAGTGLASDARREAAGELVRRAQQVLEGKGVRSQAIVREGAPAEEILAVSRELQADLVVLGSHGRGRIGRFLLGSVSEEVVRGSQSAVLIIRPR